MGAADTTQHRLKVFISYSRRDLHFADQLVAALELYNFETAIDREGIHGAEHWEERLGQLILEADIVVFVLSPDSAASEVCGWEVEQAARSGKRIVPVLCRPLDGETPHELLQALNYIFFYPDANMPTAGFGTGLIKLVDALSVDVDWLREHTRLSELADRWERTGTPDDLLARGSELAGFRGWRGSRPDNAPALTDPQRRFLAASEESDAARRNAEQLRLEEMAAAQEERQQALDRAEQYQLRLAKRTRVSLLGSALLLVLTATVAAVAWTFFREAEQARAAARSAEARAQDALDKNRLATTHYLMNSAMQSAERTDMGTAVLLLLEALPGLEFTDKAFRRQYFRRLYEATKNNIERNVIVAGTSIVSLAIGPDGSPILAGTEDGNLVLWGSGEGDPVQLATASNGRFFSQLNISSDGNYALATTNGGKVLFLSQNRWHKQQQLPSRLHELEFAQIAPDGSYFVTISGTLNRKPHAPHRDVQILKFWRRDSFPKGGSSIHLNSRVLDIAIGRDGRVLLTGHDDGTARVWEFDTALRLSKVIHIGRHGVTNLAISPKSEAFAAVSSDGVVSVWKQLGDWTPVTKFEAHSAKYRFDGVSAVGDIVFTRDGSELITGGGDDATVKVWDAGTGALKLARKTGQFGTKNLSVSRHWSQIWAMDRFGHLKVWDRRDTAPTYSEQIRYGRTRFPPTFSTTPDGQIIATSRGDNTIRIWSRDGMPASLRIARYNHRTSWYRMKDVTDDLIYTAQSAVPRCLTPSERKGLRIDKTPPEWCISMEKWPYKRKNEAVTPPQGAIQ